MISILYLVEGTHCGTGWGNHIVDEEEKSILWSEMDTLANEEVELSNSEIRRYKVLLLVQVSNTSLRSLLNDDLK